MLMFLSQGDLVECLNMWGRDGQGFNKHSQGPDFGETGTFTSPGSLPTGFLLQ